MVLCVNFAAQLISMIDHNIMTKEEMENIKKIIETLNRYTGINPIDFTQVDVSPTSTFMQDIETASGFN